MRKRLYGTRRFFSILFCIALVMTCIPTMSLPAFAVAGSDDGQVEDVGGTTAISSDVYQGAEISKTIEAVPDKENYFDIMLTAKLTETTEELSTDVVVVMDISNTMKQTVTDGKTRINAVKDAVKVFLDNYAANDKLPNKRFGAVTFNSYATNVQSLTAVNSAVDGTNIYNTAIQTITLPTDQQSNYNRVRFTNIEAGLQMAYNMLEPSTATYKYVILLTDGFPTTYIDDSITDNRTSTTQIIGFDTYMSNYKGSSSYQESLTGKEGYFAEINRGVRCEYGVDYSNRGAQKAQAVAQAMKADDINIFSIGIGLGAQSVVDYIGRFTTSNFSTVDTTGMTKAQVQAEQFVIGNTKESYEAWLGNSIAGGALLEETTDIRYLDGNSTTELEQNVGSLLDAIEVAPSVTLKEHYTVDPMGDNVEFMGFFDKDGTYAAGTALSGQAAEGAEDTATYGTTGYENSIYWNLLQSGYDVETVGNTTTYTFDLKYRVRLKNEADGFAWNTAVAANGTTTIHYAYEYKNGDPVTNGSGSENYKVPTVEGYCGILQFVKIDKDSREPLEGVTFTLKHNGANCNVCCGDAVIADVTAVSNADGIVSFTEIPSGHAYTLEETTPQGYQPAVEHEVMVSYGETYMDGVAVDGDVFVENEVLEPVTLQLQVSKVLNGEMPDANAFFFTLQGTGENDVVYDETVANDADGKATFSAMSFQKPGSYTFTIAEKVGEDTGCVYDGQEYTVVITIAEASNQTSYEAQVSVNGGATVTYVGVKNQVETVAVGSFSNLNRETGEANLKAKVTLTGRDLTEGEFTFYLKAITENAPLPESLEATNDAEGNVSFEEIPFTTAGTYVYEVWEKVVDDGGKTIADESVYTATITVTAPDDLTDNTPLQVTVVYTKEGEPVEEIPVFSNDAPHIHEWIYTPEDDTITVTCKNTEGNCPNPDGGSITLVPPVNLIYDGTPKEATLINNLLVDMVPPTIEYSKEPVEPGPYTATITIEDQPVSIEFTILPVDDPDEPNPDEPNPDDTEPDDTPGEVPPGDKPDAQPGDTTDTETVPPQTGDNRYQQIWFALMLLSGIGVLGITIYDRKTRKCE